MRPVLVAGTADYVDPNGIPFVSVAVYYGTSQFPDDLDLNDQLVIEGEEIKQCGLDCRTRFSMNFLSRQELIWSHEHFSPKRYSRSKDPYIGTISDEDLSRFDEHAS